MHKTPFHIMSCIFLPISLFAGSARDILTSVYPSGLPELVIRAILRPILSAVDYLHTRAGIIHRSIAAHHILLGLCPANDAPLVKLSGTVDRKLLT